MKFNFGNIVRVEKVFIGVVVKIWKSEEEKGHNYDVYVRSFNGIKNYREKDINHFIYDKELNEEEFSRY